MRSIGVDLGRWVKKELLQIEAARPSAFGLEMHLVRMHNLLAKRKPRVAVIDPISGLIPGGSQHDVNALVLRIVDFLKHCGATGFFTALSPEDDLQSTTLSISSLVDTWIQLRNIEANGEKNRVLYVLKSRGMAHSNQIREFLLTSHGVRLREVYIGSGNVLTGSARAAREAEERREEMRREQESQQREAAVKAVLRSVEAKIAALQTEKVLREHELTAVIGEGEARKTAVVSDREMLSRRRTMIFANSGKAPRLNGGAEKS